MTADSEAPQQSRARRLRMPAVAAVATLLIVACWIGTRRGSAQAEVDGSAPLELAGADVATVSRQALQQRLPLSGAISPLVDATVKSKVSGDVLDVAVREGQAVRRGELLLRIDTRNLRAEYDSKAANRDKAVADVALARQNMSNSQALLQQHFIAQNAFDSVVNAYRAAQADLKLADAELRLARINLDDAEVRAPFDGVVARRLVNPGEKVSPDSALIEVVDLAHMEFQAPAPASEIPSIHVGQVAQLRIAGFADRRFAAKVQRINPVAEQGSRSIMIYLSVANPDGALRGGMFGEAALTLADAAAAPAIPVSAVRRDGDADYVFVIKNGRIERRSITLGLTAPARDVVQVRTGLDPGEQVVVAQLDDLKPGMRAVLTGRRVADSRN
jgi:RND family efflux transporter MFP subunit